MRVSCAGTTQAQRGRATLSSTFTQAARGLAIHSAIRLSGQFEAEVTAGTGNFLTSGTRRFFESRLEPVAQRKAAFLRGSTRYSDAAERMRLTVFTRAFDPVAQRHSAVRGRRPTLPA
jgi:hypothetical protein